MKYIGLSLVALLAIPGTAMANEVAQTSELLQQFLGEYWGTVVFGGICVAGYTWTIVRQFISPDAMSVLPNWLITFLEWAAGNARHSSNGTFNDPRSRKVLRTK
ncbi:hypothetical protein [Photobacterium galatheae]|uniref:Uncharacterized protein n=1 Tax=Photobacterium galatheae TaxID=1654360 RepID=A0A066RR10_9GAMM|nr:hypothetical protein [Photobacterium galatheae]KDM92885.1 hypothetical protein EA58_03780 [Photobacterium galatheae]MCM0148150.1 hypothetical protein [Photobacterium galatheae]